MANSEISTVTVTNDNLAVWGARFVDYKYDNKAVDFQDLMVRITEKRAAAIEDEITPLSTRMKNRNKQLSEYGEILANISGIQAKYSSKAEGTDSESGLSEAAYNYLKKTYETLEGSGDKKGYWIDTKDNSKKIRKWMCDQVVQDLKTKIDLLNNASSEDMTRLQGIVERRDQSYSTATTLMQAIAETRGSLIKNL